MFKQLTPLTLTGMPAMHIDEIVGRLPEFLPCGATQTRAIGFVPPRGEGHPLAEIVAGHLILAAQVETKSVPAAAVKKAMKVKLDKIEQETGRRPKGKRAKEIKEEVVHELLPHAFPKTVRVPVSVGLGGLCCIGDTSSKRVDEVSGLLVEALSCKLDRPKTASSPAQGMSTWLVDLANFDDPPAGFSIDRECELKQPDGEKAVVRYSRHTLEIEEVGEHIKQGKLPTRLAMTFNGRVSFVLTEALTLKKIEILDAAVEAGTKDEKADGFDADVAIACGELELLLPALYQALGGLAQEEEQ